jgi:hypothetical protein
LTLARSGACIVNRHGYVRGRAWGYSILRGDAEWILVGVVKEYQPLQDVPFVQKTHFVFYFAFDLFLGTMVVMAVAN